jgi:dolichol-phosphate mannosyltransferase
MNPALVIIPTYNERENVEAITAAVLAAEPRVDVLVVDDNSPDGTGQLADQIAAREPRVQVLHRALKQGLGKAYLHAFAWALERNYTYVIEMDADFSHDPHYLPAMIDAAQSGADLVLGSRYVDGGGTRNWGVGRKVVSRGGSLYARTILGVEAIDLSRVRSSGYAFQIELTYRALKKGFAVREVPIVFEDRRVGHSKMSRKIFLEALTMVWRLRLDA